MCRCVPKCSGCKNGKCIHPQMCLCNDGYDWDSELLECKPRCVGDCPNGKCVGPEDCECNDSYMRHKTLDVCIPYCEESCVFGKCTKPNVCECDLGYKFQNNSISECEPICEIPCKNGKCIEPNTCECDENYIVHDKNKPHECHCGKFCVEIDEKCHCLDATQRVKGNQLLDNNPNLCTEKNCINGYCATPYRCECTGGFAKNENSICISLNETCIDESSEDCVSYSNSSAPSHSTILCDCINGVCSYDNKCFCVGGYRLSNITLNKCIPFCSKECVCLIVCFTNH